MSTGEKHARYDNAQRAAELQDAPSHAHGVGEQHGKQEILTGHEQSRHAAEQSHDAHHQVHGDGHESGSFGHSDIAALAHELWQARGCPEGSSDEDWFQAVKELRSRYFKLA